METLAFFVCILMTVVAFFFAVNYKEISNKRIIKKSLRNLEVGESIIILPEYCTYSWYIIKTYCKGKKIKYDATPYSFYITITREK